MHFFLNFLLIFFTCFQVCSAFMVLYVLFKAFQPLVTVDVVFYCIENNFLQICLLHYIFKGNRAG